MSWSLGLAIAASLVLVASEASVAAFASEAESELCSEVYSTPSLTASAALLSPRLERFLAGPLKRRWRKSSDPTWAAVQARIAYMGSSTDLVLQGPGYDLKGAARVVSGSTLLVNIQSISLNGLMYGERPPAVSAVFSNLMGAVFSGAEWAAERNPSIARLQVKATMVLNDDLIRLLRQLGFYSIYSPGADDWVLELNFKR